jgi:Ni,Fe-hydrogenase I large subunit
MGTVKIAPVNRIEGHMDLEAQTIAIGGGESVVTHVENQVVMFRGLENVMIGRDPRDCPIIAPRT